MFKALKALVSPKERLKQALGDYDVPTFPVIITNALGVLRQSEPNLNAVGQALSADPGVTVRLLKTVNSAAFGLRQPIDTVPRAACLLGRARLEAALISVGVQTALPQKRARGFEPNAFWKLSSERAKLAGAFAERLHPQTRGETVTAALLQDMALPALAHARGDLYGELLEHFARERGDLASMERAAHGFEHGEVGGWMSEAWALPAILKDAIAAHHDAPPSENPLPAAALVRDYQGADDISREQIVESARDQFNVAPDEAVVCLEAAAA